MLSIAPGYDPRYLTRQVGKGAENYYLSATVEHGEPPGRWWGRGAEALGLEPGSEIDGPVMEKLYENFLDPRDPDFLNDAVPDGEKTRLGRRKSQFQDWKTIYAKRLAAEPEATAERREQIRITAKHDARQAVIHHDATFSPPKTVTLVHAGLLAAAQQAERSGKTVLAAQYREAADVVWQGVRIGAEASLRYLQENAGEARAGYHGKDTAGRTTGRWVEANQWVVARFEQHTNRDGDPQLHIHQAILNRQLCADGKWRALDGKAIYRARPAAAVHGERVMTEYLARRLGLEFRSRPDGNGREVVGVSPELIAEFSTRRAAVTKDIERQVEAYVAKHGRQPTARQLFTMGQIATKETKRPKTKSPDAPSPAEQLRSWEERTRAQEIQRLSEIPGKVLGRLSRGRAAAQAQALGDAELAKVIQAAVADAQKEKAEFSRFEITRFIDRYLPDYLGGLHPERVEAVLEELTDAALNPAGPAGVRLLTAPDVVHIPESLRRADGRSVYQAQACERYVTADQLDREAALTKSALAGGAPRLTAERVAELIGLTHEQAALAALDARTAVPEGVKRLYADQANAVLGIATSSRRTDVLLGAAGTGKSRTVAALAEVWRAGVGKPVLGLTTAQNAAGVLRREGLDDASNIALWLTQMKNGQVRLVQGQLIVVDEASMVTTEHLEQIQRYADQYGAKVVWAGDVAQLSAPEAGGVMRHLVNVGGAEELHNVVRFREEWEREASVQLRDGLAEALVEYDHHGRLQDGTREEMETAAYQEFLADHLAGKSSLLLAPTNEKAAELAARVREELVALQKVAPEGARLHDGNTAGRGDLIVTRQNVKGEDGEYAYLNRDVMRVADVSPDGKILARLVNPDGTYGNIITLDQDYVRDHVELAYAGTVHAAQGRTVVTCHSLVDDSGTREMLYVMMTRGAEGNYAYVVVDRVREADLRPGPEQAQERAKELLGTQAEPQAAEWEALGGRAQGDRFTVLSGILEREDASKTAIEAMIEEGERPRNLGHLGSMWIDQIRSSTAEAYITRAEQSGALSASDAARLRDDEAKDTLGRLLRTLEMSGRDAGAIFEAAIRERELDTAESVAQTLHWRIKEAGAERGIDVTRLEVSEEQIRGTWRERTPSVGIPETDRLLGEISARMEVREAELGQDALERPPAWLTQAIGEPHPDDVIERGAWAERAGRIMAYREQYGYETTTEAIGPAPSRANPEARAAWWSAYDAMGRPDTSREISGATDGELWVLRARYEREARWAPPHVGEELRQTSLQARERENEAVRLRAQARSLEAHNPEGAAALEGRARGQEALARGLKHRVTSLTEVHEARKVWHKTTEAVRSLAMRADAELRRREHIDERLLPPLHVDQAEARERIEQQRQDVEREKAPAVAEGQLTLDLGPKIERAAAWAEQERQDVEREQENERERQHQDAEREQMPGQQTLELFGVRSVDREADPALAEALEAARAARAIIEVREAERGEREPEQEHQRTERSRQVDAQSIEREQQRAAMERNALEEHEHGRAEREREPQYRAPNYDDGPEMGRGR
ncbi:MobF family relaxase [Planobispora rosea]|uniref:MobF family relaxase n=1 Tax=Planobispora rosea TaxID=35762 RepID=UPI00083B0B0F|nr:MobF family relaxase [Planobispora rosea]